MTVTFSILAFFVGCITAYHTDPYDWMDYRAEIFDQSDVDPQYEYCAEHAEQAYRMIYRERQVACTIRARAKLCPGGEKECQEEAVTFCRVATKLLLLQEVERCLGQPEPEPRRSTYL